MVGRTGKTYAVSPKNRLCVDGALEGEHTFTKTGDSAGVVPNFDPPHITTPLRVNAHSLIVNAPYFNLVRGALPADNIILN